MNNSQNRISSINALLVILLTLTQTLYSQSYCPILEEEYNLGAIAKAGDEYLLLQSSGSIWRSTDAINWVENEIEVLSDVDEFGYPVAMAFFNKDKGIVASTSNPDATKSSLYHTEDGGITWTRSKLMLQDGTIEGFYPHQLFALDEETVVMDQVFRANLYISYNSGATWSSLDAYVQSGSAVMDVTFIDKDIWYLPTHNGLYKTSDQLETAELLIDKDFIEFHASANSNSMYGLTYTTGGISDLYYSDNEFSTWEKISLNESIPDLSFVISILEADDILYLFENKNMHYSTDHGQSWAKSSIENAFGYGGKVTQIDDEIYAHRGEMLKFNCSPVSTNENDIENGFGIYPNPTSGEIFFDNPNNLDLQYRLYDYSGKRIKDSTFTNSFNLSGYPNGIYFVHIINRISNERVIEKLVLIK